MCDTLCLRTDAGMVFAKNSDRPPDEAQVVLAHVARERRRRARHAVPPDPRRRARTSLVGSHPTWLWGVEHGVNEHGVAIGNEQIWTIDDPRAQPPACSAWISCASVSSGRARADDALDAMTAALDRARPGRQR